MNDLLKLAIDGHGGMRRRKQLSGFRAAVLITGAIWALKAKDPDGFLVRDSVSVAIDITDVAFSWEHTHARIVTQPSQVRDRNTTARSG